nr:hypothetical protein Iba_scaffold24346CG0060 [Ipomoea batatas]
MSRKPCKPISRIFTSMLVGLYIENMVMLLRHSSWLLMIQILF